MPRLSIDISPQQHQQLKAMAALKGQSIKDYVLGRALVDMPDPATMTDAEALQALKELLAPRLAEVEAGQVVAATADDIKRTARSRRGSR
ncbi:antitoxin [Marinibaculum pumilum]|uniref:Antitoxin n=1 Tax=Marinibaculum pumilum TaxID=1766165 RepID=A0ABV7L149_9PROT